MIIEKAPAKINLALDVIKKREDNFHDLKMVMTTVDLYDTLSFEVLKEDKIKIECDKLFVPTDERNLVYKAIAIIKSKFKINQGIKVYIKKQIPVSAGLAGGSSDAAAAIRALNRIFKLELTDLQLYDIGKEVGSDVPFCIYNKTAKVTGRGEFIEPLPKVPSAWVILAKPNFGVSTKEVFQNIDLTNLFHPNIDKVIEGVKNKNYKQIIDNIGNSLESVTFNLYPEVKLLKEKIKELGVDAALMSGSGPTIYGITKSERKANRIINSLDKRIYECHAVRILG